MTVRPLARLTVPGTLATHPCHRGATRCPGRAPTPKAWCSDGCRRLDALVKACGPPQGPVSQGGSANVHQARGLGWLDVRVKEAA